MTLNEAIDYMNRNGCLPLCEHGKHVVDWSGEALEPPCGCRLNPYEWRTCQMQFKRVKFHELDLGQLVWHNIIGSSDRWLNGPFVVGDQVIVNTSNVSIPISLLGPDIIWYTPAPAHGAEDE